MLMTSLQSKDVSHVHESCIEMLVERLEGRLELLFTRQEQRIADCIQSKLSEVIQSYNDQLDIVSSAN